MHKKIIYGIVIALLCNNIALGMTAQQYQAHFEQRKKRCCKCALVSSVLAAVFGIPAIIAIKTLPTCTQAVSLCEPPSMNMTGKCWSLVDGSSACANSGPTICPSGAQASAGNLVAPYNGGANPQRYCARVADCPSKGCLPPPQRNETS